MKGNEVVLAGFGGRGVYGEGTIVGTPKPGTILQLKAGVAEVSGRFSYEVYNKAADGEAAPLIILREDHLQGKTYDDAYVTGTRGSYYIPAVGERVNLLVKASSGAITIGLRYMVDVGTGLLIPYVAGAGVVAVAVALEAASDPASNRMTYFEVIKNG